MKEWNYPCKISSKLISISDLIIIMAYTHIYISHKIFHMLHLFYCLLRHRLYVYLCQLLTTPVYHLTFYVITNLLLSQPFNSTVLLHFSHLSLLIPKCKRLLSRIAYFLQLSSQFLDMLKSSTRVNLLLSNDLPVKHLQHSM